MSIKHKPDSVKELRRVREEKEQQETERQQVFEEAKQATSKIAALTERVEAYEVRLAAGEKPVPGAAWSSLITYLRDEVVERNGKQYVALRYSKNKPPEENTDLWELLPDEIPIPAWTDITDGAVIEEGTVLTHDGKVWVCISQHIKSTVYKPKAGSSKWEEAA